MSSRTLPHRFSREALHDAIAPPALTIVGATDRNRLTRQAIGHMRSQDLQFRGEINLVNPRRPTIEGIEAVADVSEIEGELGQLILLLPTDQCMPYLETLHRMPTGVFVRADGFGEAGNVAGEQALAEWSLERGVPLFGPQSVGTAALHDNFWSLHIPLAGQQVTKGPLAIVSQSGGLFFAIVHALSGRSVGVHTLVSSGSEAVVDYADVGLYLLEDESVEALAIYAESLHSTERFVAFAQRAAGFEKPVVLLVTGRSDVASDIARSHTGAAVTPRRIVQGIADQYGLLLANDFDEFIWSLEALAATGYRRVGSTGGVGVLSDSGGMTVLFAETLADAGVELPEPRRATRDAVARHRPVTTFNPVDLGALTTLDPDTYRELLTAYAVDPTFEVIADVVNRPALEGSPEFLVHHQAMFLEIVRRAGKTPMLACVTPLAPAEFVGDERLGDCVVGYGSREAAVKLRTLSTWARSSGLHLGLDDLPQELVADSYPLGEAAVLTGPQLRDLLNALPLRWPGEVTVASVEELPSALERLGLPLVAKAEVGLAHRASQGAVLVGLTTWEEVETAVTYLTASFKCAVTLSQYVEHEQEHFLGFERNEGEGRLLGFGEGGARVGENVDLRVLPATREQLRRLINRSVQEHTEQDQLLALAIAFQQFVLEASDVRAIDLNPVVFDRHGRLTALDVKIHR